MNEDKNADEKCKCKLNLNSNPILSSKGTKINFSNCVENFETLEKFISDCGNHETLFMIDSKERIWEIINRQDLTIKDFTKYKRIDSVKTILHFINEYNFTNNYDLNFHFNLNENSNMKSFKNSSMKKDDENHFFKKSNEFENENTNINVNNMDFEISFDSKFND